jgi:hypothetical protein
MKYNPFIAYSPVQFLGSTIPDQKGMPIKNPTARWIFQLFVGIHVLELPDGKQMTLNLRQEHRDILSLLSCWNIYS